MADQIKYTQEIDEKTGQIKYVPVNPPNPPPPEKIDLDTKRADKKMGDGSQAKPDDIEAYGAIKDAMKLDLDDNLVTILKRIEDNNRKLRYDKRLQRGKLDGRRLTAFRTSDRLFKKKAIKHKNYQFAIMVDTSGSMFHTDESYDTLREQLQKSKMKVAIESVIQVVKALEELKIDVSVIAMNEATHLVKPYGSNLNIDEFNTLMFQNIFGVHTDDSNRGEHLMGGTSERVAYEETLAYMDKHRKPKQLQAVFVLSDGAPSSSASVTPIVMENDDPKNPRIREDYSEELDSCDSLRDFWKRRSDVKAYGIGIMSNAMQIPTRVRVDKVAELPVAMNKLIQDILV